MTHSFSISEALEKGWHLMRMHSGLIFQMMLSLFALQVVSTIVSRTLQGTLIGFLASFALGVLGIFMGVGMTLIALRLARGHAAHYQDLFPNWFVVLRFMCANILAGLVVLVPLLIGGLIIWGAWIANVPLLMVALCIATAIVCVYVVIRYSFVRFAVLDGAGIVESLSRSAVLTRGHIWHLILFLLVLILINIIGAVLLLVGLLVSVPVSLLAYAHVYVKLDVHHHPQS